MLLLVSLVFLIIFSHEMMIIITSIVKVHNHKIFYYFSVIKLKTAGLLRLYILGRAIYRSPALRKFVANRNTAKQVLKLFSSSLTLL